MMDKLNQSLSNVENLLFKISNLCLFVMMVFISINATTRYLLEEQLPGLITIIELYLMMGIFWFAISHVQRNNQNIALDIFYQRLSSVQQDTIDFLSQGVILCIFGFMLRETALVAWARLLEQSAIFGVITIPTYISWIVLVIGLATLCLRILLQFVTNLHSVVQHTKGHIPK